MRGFLLTALAVLCVGAISTASASEDEIRWRASLRGISEVPPINSEGTGTFRATIHEDGSITFRETFNNLTSPIIFSHIHFGETHVAGGVMIFLCGGDSQPACPANSTSGSYEGTITAANVTGPTGQGVTPGDLVSALRNVNSGAGYVNIHTTKFPGGEIRGQVIVNRDDNDRDER
jgi:hypothetical protein